MKRLNATEWTDGKHIYVGNPRDGFKLKVNEEPPVLEDAVIETAEIEATGEQ